MKEIKMKNSNENNGVSIKNNVICSKLRGIKLTIMGFKFFSSKPKPQTLLLHISLFVLTFFASSIAGVMWANQDYTELSNISFGFTYAVLILTFLSAHEFGHYIAARFHGVDATLPFYIPFPPILGMPSFGTLGAVIKTRTPIQSRRALFDIGAAGPLAGFVVCVIFLLIGMLTLPQKEIIYLIHPEYLTEYGGVIPTSGLHFGDTIFYWFMSNVFANPSGWLPPMNEIYHFPFLNVGWFGLFVTTLNLLPFGQLDGGHIAYAMFGNFQKKIAKVVFVFLIVLGSCSLFGLLYQFLQMDYPAQIYIIIQDSLLPPLTWINNNIPFIYSFWDGWLFWAFIGLFFVKLKHPEIPDNIGLDTKRKVLGWIAFAVLITSFSWNGILIIE
jgi:hypothetical protein